MARLSLREATDEAAVYRNGARDSMHHDGTTVYLQQLVDLLRE
jgi:hypothetical protein